MRDIDKLFLVMVALVVLLVYMASRPDRTYNSDGATKLHDEVITDIQLSDGSIVHDVKASDLGPGINETAYQAMLDDLEHNLTIHIAANATQNVSIWKGDKLVCYIHG